MDDPMGMGNELNRIKSTNGRNLIRLSPVSAFTVFTVFTNRARKQHFLHQ